MHAATAALLAEAAALADELGLPLCKKPGEQDALLELGEQGLFLRALGTNPPGPLCVDFAEAGLLYRRRSGHNEPLGRALGVTKWPGMSVVDATAGLGRESYVIADLGARVVMLERHTVVYALLRDGLQRGQRSEDSRVSSVCEALSLYHADGREWLPQASADAVYLDPMFPTRQKSARVKKGMWLFQQLLDEQVDSAAERGLLNAALSAATRRVVVKRPRKAPPLADLKPGFDVPGKTVRFDVYIP